LAKGKAILEATSRKRKGESGKFRSPLMFIQITARRNGVEEVVHHNNIMVGDILKIKAGMNIPVDGVILRSSGV
jgi:cation transport ATPase